MALGSETLGKTAIEERMGITFDRGSAAKIVPAELIPAEEAMPVRGPLRAFYARHVKPGMSNLFLLGCLLGLFLLYCGSCIVYALSFPSRRKSS